MSRKAQSAAKYAALSKSKKNKTPNRSSILSSTVPYAEYETGGNESGAKQADLAGTTQVRRRKVNQIDYHYVLSDIKRIAVIGGTMLVALAILSQVIH